MYMCFYFKTCNSIIIHLMFLIFQRVIDVKVSN